MKVSFPKHWIISFPTYIPIAIFSHDSRVQEPSQFKLERPYFKALNFNFFTIQLKHKHWRNGIDNNPIAAALISNMDYEESEKMEMKMESIRIIEENDLDLTTKGMLVYFFDRYIILDEVEKEIVKSRVLQKYGKRGVEEYMDETAKRKYRNTYEAGLRRGEEKGINKGIKKVARNMILGGTSIEEISNYTGLSIEELNEMKNILTI